jgi:hypothetical protein
MFGLEIKNPSRSPRRAMRVSDTGHHHHVWWCGVWRCDAKRRAKGKFAQYAVYLSLPVEVLFLSSVAPLFCSVSRIFLADSSDTHLQ